jgi:hypothetical protein
MLLRNAASASSDRLVASSPFADPVVADRQIPLTVHVAGIRSRQLLRDGKVLLKGRERVRALAHRTEQISDGAVADRQVSLSIQVSGVGGGQDLRNGQLSAIDRQGLVAHAGRN